MTTKNDMTKQLTALIKDRKTLVLIDAANLYYGMTKSKIYINFTQFHSWFEENSDLVKIYYYTAIDQESQKQKDFLDALTNQGYEIISKPLKIFEGSKKGNMDIELAVDALEMRDSYETLVLVSGDGDFTYLVKSLEKKCKKVIVLGIGGFVSFELHKEANNFFFFDRIKKVWHTPLKKVSQKDVLISTEEITDLYENVVPKFKLAIEEIPTLKLNTLNLKQNKPQTIKNKIDFSNSEVSSKSPKPKPKISSKTKARNKKKAKDNSNPSNNNSTSGQSQIFVS